MLKYHLHLTDAELQLFADSAVRFNQKELEFNQRLAEIRNADHEQHPTRMACSRKADEKQIAPSSANANSSSRRRWTTCTRTSHRSA
ncbi:MAG TPA: hypothetical protein VI386_16115 [Candidatus Sulfotelmatobacter sp.]